MGANNLNHCTNPTTKYTCLYRHYLYDVQPQIYRHDLYNVQLILYVYNLYNVQLILYVYHLYNVQAMHIHFNDFRNVYF